MHCTQEFLRSEIEVLGEIVEEINSIVTKLKNGVNGSHYISLLERLGIIALADEIHKECKKYEDRHNDIVSFKINDEGIIS